MMQMLPKPRVMYVYEPVTGVGLEIKNQPAIKKGFRNQKGISR